MSDDAMRVEVDADADAECEEFGSAVEAYRQSSGRMFPTWSEILEVLISLGYRKPDAGRVPPEAPSTADRPGYLVRIDPDCEPGRVDRIALAIESRGGRMTSATDPEIFAFRTESARDAAVEAVRRTFGWTTVHSA